MGRFSIRLRMIRLESDASKVAEEKHRLSESMMLSGQGDMVQADWSSSECSHRCLLHTLFVLRRAYSKSNKPLHRVG